MKKIHKILLGSIASVLSLATVTTAVVACSPKKDQKQNVNTKLLVNKLFNNDTSHTTKPTMGDDYLINLDTTNGQFANILIDPYKSFELFAKNLDAAGYSISSHEPLKNSGKTTFLAYAQDLNAKVKAYVKAIANLPTIKALRDKNTTVLFAETTKKFDPANPSASSKLIDLNFFQQPFLFPILYSSPNSEVPGFGFHFPKPIDNKSDKYFDNWYGIGAATNSATNQTEDWKTTLNKSFNNTSDYVIYNYDSNKLVGEVANGLEVKKSFEDWFKKEVRNDKLLLVDFQFDYASIWGPIGTVHFAESYAKKFGVTDAELKSISALKPQFVTKEKLAKIRPQNPTEVHTNFATDFYSLMDYTIALGIQPDYALYNNEKGTTYPKVAGVFADKIDLTKTEFKYFRGKSDEITSMKLYAIAVNTTHKNNLYGEYIGEGKAILKSVETERGDSPQSRIPHKFKFYDRKNNTLHEVKLATGPANKFLEA